MRNLIVGILAILAVSANCQVIGNGKVITKSYSLDEVYRVNIQMYAKVTIDMNEEPGVTIIGESNIIDLIRQRKKNGELLLDQKKWIEPTKDIIIKIGAPRLREVEMGTHDKTKVTNITGDIFKVLAPIGTVVLEGEADELRVKSKMGTVDASKLKTKSANVNIKSDGNVIVNASTIVECDLNEDATFKNVNGSATITGCNSKARSTDHVTKNARYINLKIKNNSLKRNHFVVVGPKPNGRNFSYGFAMMPFQSKKERWTVGSKIYKENSVGIRTLLATLTDDDEGKTVKLFE